MYFKFFTKMPRNKNLGMGMKYSNALTTVSANEKAELVSVYNNRIVTTSLRVAEYFGKEHYRVLRAISELECSDDFRAANFGVSNYTKQNGNVKKSYPMYYLTRDGFTFLAMGFTGKVAAQFKEAYIKAFDEMEEMLRKQQCTKYAERLLKSKIRRLNKSLAEGITALRKRHGINYGPAGDIQRGIMYMDGCSFEDNLKNIFAQVQNAYLDGYFFAGDSITSSKKLEEARKAAWNLLNKI